MGQKDYEGMENFFQWLDTNRDLIETTPLGYIQKVMAQYKLDTNNELKDKWTASRWIRIYRIKHNLKIKRLSHPYVPHRNYKSNYCERSLELRELPDRDTESAPN